MKRYISKKGFSLVELIVVIAIMAILAAIIVPVTLNKIDDADRASVLTEIDAVYSNLLTTYGAQTSTNVYTTVNDLCDAAGVEVQVDSASGNYGYIVAASSTQVTVHLTYKGEIITEEDKIFSKSFAAHGITPTG